MRYPALRHISAVGLIAILWLITSLLSATVAPASAAVPLASSDEETVSIEISIKSDDDVTTTFLATAPSDDEQSLKEFCVEENFSKNKAKPKVTFSSEDGTPTCKAVLNTSISGNNYVSHDGDEYVVDTSNASETDKKKNSSVTLSVIFPGKVTDAGGGTIEGEKQNKVSFNDFYDNKTRGKDTAEATSSSRSASSTGVMIIIVFIIIAMAVGGAIALISNSNKKNRERRYLAALGQQSFNAPTGAPAYQSLAQSPQASPVPGTPAHPQTYPPQAPQQAGFPPSATPVGQAGYPGAPSYHQQPPGSAPPGAGGPHPSPNHHKHGSP